MKFGNLAVEECAGAILAHGLRVADGVFKKGRLLDADDVAVLRDAGYVTVMAAQLEAGDVREDQAAAALAVALAGDGVRIGQSFTGRCNLFAQHGGLLLADAQRLNAMNRVDEAMTVATLAAHTQVSERQLLATVKIIPFAVARDHLGRAESILASDKAAVRVAAFRSMDVALVQTQLPGTRQAVLDKTTTVTRRRLEALGSRLILEKRCEHNEAALTRTLNEILGADVQMLLIAGASAIVDRRDVVPAAIVAIGGRLDHFGMPVDPGNLLLLAHRGDTPVLGLPGCARSPKFNGFDQVLERLLAGVAVASPDIMGMGVGGLLKETRERAQPRSAPSPDSSAGRAPRIAALVLAAGQSRRMGSRNKLLASVDGVPMVVRAVDAAMAGVNAGVYVVTGHEHEQVAGALAGRDVHVVHNPRYADGLSTSLAQGLAALGPEVDGALVCLGDMPRVTTSHIKHLVEAFDPLEGRAICVPMWEGKRGHPVLWARRFFPEMVEIKGDVGARHLLGEYAELVAEIPVADDGVLVDVDSPAALRAIGGGD
ncbi:MAG: molybdopterin-binding/glycosyltransferase family 2 protein [Gammaproteobacteria bacterium]|nr:molybdopterin-binding/glycosyltransferase family 2 protein [Gammaproteobacteria bacterium]MDX2458469.1 molybdopterin-binding/glycosyltransferase family 2 protein [Gammaproteobacteria bacterium]